MPSLYLQARDYPLYGVPEGTTPAAVIQASLLIDGFLAKPHGLLVDNGMMSATGGTIVERVTAPRKRVVKLGYRPVTTILSALSCPYPGQLSWQTMAGGLLEGTDDYLLPDSVAYSAWVQISYLAGWAYEELPGAIKLACARMITHAVDTDGVSGNIKRAITGDSSVERFSATAMDEDTAALLAPYRRIF